MSRGGARRLPRARDAKAARFGGGRVLGVTYDLILRGATLISGDGSDRFAADLAVAGDRIAAIGSLDGEHAASEIDASGKVLAPGFIDVHTHDDAALLSPDGMDPKIS